MARIVKGTVVDIYEQPTNVPGAPVPNWARLYYDGTNAHVINSAGQDCMVAGTIGTTLPFSDITAGTGTAALVIGTGGSITVSGSGTVNATSLGGTAAASYALIAGPTFTGTVTIPNGAALGTPTTLVLTNATGLPAAAVNAGTFASGMVLVAPALGTPASGVLTTTSGYLWNNLASATGALVLANGTNATTINQTSAAAITLGNTTPTLQTATVLSQVTINSPIAGQTTYTGTITGGGSNAYAGAIITTAGFTNGGNNAASQTVLASTTTTLVVTTVSQVNETHAGTAGSSSTTNQSSPIFTLNASSASAGSSVVDGFTFQAIPASSSSNATNVLTIKHATSGGGGSSLAFGTNSQFTVSGTGAIVGQGTLTLGTSGTSGTITMNGSTSGSCTITPPATAGTATNPIAFSNSINLASTCVYQSNGTSGITAGNFTAVTSINSTAGLVTTLSGTSDARLKDVIAPLAGGLDAINAITPVKYRWNAKGVAQTGLDGNQVFIGFIAQDVQKAVPEAITATEASKSSDETFLCLDDKSLIATLVLAVKELSAEVDRLKGLV